MSSPEPDAVPHNNLGNALFDQGRILEAIEVYRQALQTDPDYADAHNNLGIALHAQGQISEAIESFRAALRIDPDYANALNNLGNALRQHGQSAEAAQCYRQALRINPDHPLAHNNLGLALVEQGKFGEAINSFRQALRINPRYANALNNLGTALTKSAQPDEAEECFRQALRIDPSQVSALNNLGSALTRKGRLAEAVACHRHALRLSPGDADTLVHLGSALGVTLRGQGNLAEAELCYRQALRTNPTHALAHRNLGSVLVRQGQLPEAIASLREAVRLEPHSGDGLCHLGVALQWQGELIEAAACLEEALRLEPENTAARSFRGMLRLLQGNFEEGWADYEFRLAQPGRGETYLDRPRWDGSALPDRTILVYAEQGLGDTIQFIRYAALVKERVGTVLFECQPPLLPLLKEAAGIDQLIPRGARLPSFDVRVPLLSLPAVFDTRLATIPARVPYLQADTERVAFWAKKLAPRHGLKIGIAWQGDPDATRDRQRSVSLGQFACLAKGDVCLVSLQKGPGSEQIHDLAGRFAVVDLGDRLDTFVETAAVMMNLDLIITVDTAVAHLAGALGRPVWVAVSYIPDWRWLLGREDSPWYPTMRLFRQSRPGEWAGVFERIVRNVAGRKWK